MGRAFIFFFLEGKTGKKMNFPRISRRWIFFVFAFIFIFSQLSSAKTLREKRQWGGGFPMMAPMIRCRSRWAPWFGRPKRHSRAERKKISVETKQNKTLSHFLYPHF